MTSSVISDLVKVRDIQVVSDQDRKKALKELAFQQTGLTAEDTSDKLGHMLGGDLIFTGSYAVIAGQIRVNARIINVETGKIEKARKFDGAMAQYFAMEDQLVAGLLADVEKVSIANLAPVRVSEEEKKAIASEIHPSLSGFELFSKGLLIEDAHPQEALALFNEALRNEPDYIDALLEAGWVAGVTLNNFDEGLRHLNKAEQLLAQRNRTNSTEYANLTNIIGTIHQGKGELNQALKYYELSQRILIKNNQTATANYGTLLNNIGMVYRTNGDPDRALKQYILAKQLDEQLMRQHTTGYADTLNNIGNVYEDRGDLNQALKYLSLAREIKEKLGLQNTVGYANIMNNMGTVHAMGGDLDQALSCFMLAKDTIETTGSTNTVDYANTLSNIGSVYNYRRELDQALKYYILDKEIQENLGLKSSRSYGKTLFNIGTVLEKQRRPQDAGKHYRAAYNAFVAAGDRGELQEKARTNAERLGQ